MDKETPIQGFQHVALIGLGLIASSIAHALHRLEKRPKITGYARSKETRDRARTLGFCDMVAEDLGAAVMDADLVILCVPVRSMGTVMAEIAPYLRSDVLVSDVGSVKREVLEAVTPHLPDECLFIPAHPIAGTEKSGPDAGFATLFENRYCLLTPERKILQSARGEKALARLVNFWQSLGAIVETMDIDHHDLVLAVTSHIPHLIAYTMVGVADHLSRVTQSEIIKYSAAGFRDFTRIAASDPTMWRDVFLANKGAVLDILGRFTEEIFALQRAIRQDEEDVLFEYFTRTRAIRSGIIKEGQDVDIADFGRAILSHNPKT